MLPLFKISLLLLLLILLFPHSSSGKVEVFNNGMNGAYEGNAMKMTTKIAQGARKLIAEVDGEIDYHYPGPNPKHGPRKGSRPGGGGGGGARKLIAEVDAVLDYDYGGPNPKHDPRKGKPGGGGW